MSIVMDNEDYRYYLSLDKCLVGRVRVDISTLSFSDASRRETPRITKKKRSSKNGTGCSRHDPQSRISAHIDPAELDRVLLASQQSRANLQASFLPGAVHPKLNTTGTSICCFNGRHRLKAAEHVYDEDDRWWTIELYSFELNRKYRLPIINYVALITAETLLDQYS
jgi:hypothetical protein